MTVGRFISSEGLFKKLLFFLNIILIPWLVNGQELSNASKKNELNITIMSLILDETKLNNEMPKGEFIIVNYSEDRDQIKVAVLDKYDFSDILVSYKKEVVGITKCGSRTFAFFGDSGVFIEDVHEYEKIDNYIRYYMRTNRQRKIAAKKQGLIYFPTTKDPLSAFFNFDGEKITYLRSEFIFVLDDSWGF